MSKDNAINWEVKVLYCSINRDRISKRSEFLSNIDNNFSISSIDLSTFDEFSKSWRVKLFQLLVGSSISDSLSLKSFIKDFKIFGIGSIKFLFSGYKKKLEDHIINKLFDPESVLKALNPDFIFFDNRVVFKNKASLLIADYLANSNRKIIMIPHAPHGAAFDDEFFGIKQDLFPSHIEYWGCLNKAIPPKEFYNKGRQSTYYFIGLPALDESWKNSILKKRSSVALVKKPLYILYIPGKISEPYQNNKDHNIDIVAYEEELLTLKSILENLDNENIQYKLVVKPHPKISVNTINNLIFDLSHPSIVCSQEPLYLHMEYADFVISEFSTAVIYCACYVPIMRIKTKQERYFSNQWKYLDELYSGLGCTFSKNNTKRVLALLEDENLYSENVSENRKHLSKYFGNNVADRAISRLRSLKIDE